MANIDDIMNPASKTVTTSQVVAAVEMIRAAYGLVATYGNAGMPSGHLYAHMMSAGMDLEGYDKMIALMVRTQILSKRGLLLIAAKV